MEGLKMIRNFEDYFINKEGQVFSKRKNGKIKPLKVRHHPTGYKYIGIYSIDELGKRYRKWLRVHRVVYEAFVGKIPKGYDIDHINSDRGDNRLVNLQLLTHRENIIKSWKTRKQKKQ